MNTHARKHASRWPLARRALACALLASGLAAPARADDDNPFARPGPTTAGPAAAPSPLDTLELRGVLTLSGTTIVTLFDTASSRSTIVNLGGTVNGITVSDYKTEDDSVLVQSGGREKRVKIKKAQIVTMATPPPAPVPPGPQVAGVPPPPGPQTAPMDDQEVRNRMERVAQEIRRRREMRREMMERAQQQQQQQQQQQ